MDLIKKFDPSCKCYFDENFDSDTFTLSLVNCQSDRNRDILEFIGHKPPYSPSLDTKNFSIVIYYEALINKLESQVLSDYCDPQYVSQRKSKLAFFSNPLNSLNSNINSPTEPLRSEEGKREISETTRSMNTL